MTEIGEDGWRPDELLVPALLAGSQTTMADLRPPDRAWAVAVMRDAGLTAEEIGHRLECSVRLVRSIWSDAGVLAALYLTERENFGNEMRMVGGEVTRLTRELAEMTACRNRYKNQLDLLLDAHLLNGNTVMTFPCGCPRTRYNTYIAPKTGKAGCREHRRQAVARHREQRRRMVTTSA